MTPDPVPALMVRDIAKRYGAVQAVDGLTLDVREGEVFGFLGPNGAGKTTSINIMCGLLRPDRGTVLVGGVDPYRRALDARLRLGVCPQGIVLWNMLTCMEQLVFMAQMHGVTRRLARRRGRALLETMGLEEQRDRLARTLSGGMRRRLNLVMALVHDPDIIVLDEPEAGLDPQSRVFVRGYIRSLAGKKTIILTTHNMDEADRLADRVAIIDHGRLLAVDTPGALKRTVGRGDVLEIDLDDPNEQDTGFCLESLREIVSQVHLVDRTLVIKGPRVVDILASVIERLKTMGLHPGEIRLRENTLEDVFMSLTGERLRE